MRDNRYQMPAPVQPTTVANKNKNKDKGGNKNKNKNRNKNREQKRLNKAIQNTQQVAQTAQDWGNQMANQYLPEGTFETVDVQTAADVQANLDAQREFANQAFQMSAAEQEALDALRSGMSGYAAPEVQAMREAAQQEINMQMQQALEAARMNANRSGIVGGAANAAEQDARLAAVGARGNLERDLVIQNAQEMQGRREAFANLVRSTEDARFGRTQSARDSYTGALATEEAARRGRETFNVGQHQNEALARSGLALSGAGMFSGMLGEERASNLANKQFRWGKRRDQRIMRMNEQLANQWAQQAQNIMSQYQSAAAGGV